MATYVKFEAFSEDVCEKVHNFASDTLKVALTNTAPTAATDHQLSDITQIAAGNGYTTGGTAVTNTTCTEASGTTTVDGDDVVFTASGGAMANFRYIVLYNDTATNDELIMYADYGSTVSLADTETFTVAWNASGIFTLA